MIYGPDNGWYYRVTGSKVERAFPSTGRTWEEVAPGTVAHLKIKAMVPVLVSQDKVVSPLKWGKVLVLQRLAAAKAAEDSRLTSSAPSFQPSFYSPPSTTPRQRQRPRQQAAPRQRDDGGRSSNVPALVGVGVAGVGALLVILRLVSRP